MKMQGFFFFFFFKSEAYITSSFPLEHPKKVYTKES